MSRIVICDNDVQVCRFFQAALQRHLFEVEIVHTAQTCLAACRTAVPQLLVTDLHLPDMGALEMLRLLRVHMPGTPIIAISADNDEILQEAWLNGADWVMRKPILPALLIQTARHLISTRPATP